MELHPSREVRIFLDESYSSVIRIFDNIWKIHENMAVICRQWFNNTEICCISITSGALSSFSISMCTWNNHDFIFWQNIPHQNHIWVLLQYIHRHDISHSYSNQLTRAQNLIIFFKTAFPYPKFRLHFTCFTT